MSVVHGFGGMKIRDGMLSFEPRLPEKWTGLSFTILHRGRTLMVRIQRNKIRIDNLEGSALELYLEGKKIKVEPGSSAEAELTSIFHTAD